MVVYHQGDFEVEGPRESVFEVLASPEICAPVLPGFLDIRVDNTLETAGLMRLSVGTAGLLGTASVELQLADFEPHVMLRYSGEGSLNKSVFKYSVGFHLEGMEQMGTCVNWDGRVHVNSKALKLMGIGDVTRYTKRQVNVAVARVHSLLEDETATRT